MKDLKKQQGRWMIGHCMNHHPIKAMIALLWLMTFSIHADAQLISAPVNNLRDEKIDTLVLCPFDFQPALAKWLTYRRGQGYQVRVESPAPIAAGIKQQIQIVAATNPLKRWLARADDRSYSGGFGNSIGSVHGPSHCV